MSVQVFPGANAPTTIVLLGRTYTCAVGSVITVPDADALMLMANGWCRSAQGTGATAARPSNPNVGFEFYDTTVGGNVIWNGKNWINHATGATA